MTFENFWQQYPRKIGKLTAKRSWEKLSQENQQKALEAIVEHRKYWSAKGTDWEFIPHASTWLNQERFEDELVIQEKKKENIFKTVWNDIAEAFRTMPLTMKQLIPVKFFTWYAMFCYWQYITSSLSLSLFGTTDQASEGFSKAQQLTGSLN